MRKLYLETIHICVSPLSNIQSAAFFLCELITGLFNEERFMQNSTWDFWYALWGVKEHYY